MNGDIDSMVAELPRMDSVTPILRVAAARLDDGDAAFVADLGIALWLRYRWETAPPQVTEAFEQLLRLLLGRPGVLDQAVRLLCVAGDRRTERVAASMIAARQPTADLGVVFRADAPAELRACLAQELVLRGAEIDPRWVDPTHPLGWLPPSLTSLDASPALPVHQDGRVHLETPELEGERVHGHGGVPEWRETTTSDRSALLGAAVAGWVRRSNGRIEARTFAFDRALSPDAAAGALVSIGLHSTEGMTAGLLTCSPSQAWERLFIAAAYGAAYEPGEAGAYGRLYAWRSVAGLVGAPADTPVHEVAAVAHGCSWYSFAGATRWFEDVVGDLGLAAVAPDRRGLAVLAATDTD
ncbi:hypothetical protein ACWT_4592 [Actinoplanes sp. SE50]|uniref:DUF6183 family protein n=1 Tax=unclassified Actinoplanes TaxID=2626549 RepID=UPI00023ED476|nr:MULTISPECIES: DUF6183 family protein [unclassified Actinoplanes]AEV85614.1 hypothetical protein ACPL_4723 [Actinoplanes sp. SE50/110]ATO84007.1 hypothetical protein ACWT_4592 [Actinoplanes sp. SE50]SLM01417.1 hypothetical protein ACSP50_4653 [Actinoplanes sp. SE50/110]